MATIVIDPGHYGGYNKGVCPDYYEGNTMLKLAEFLGQELQDMGAMVKYTRTTNEQNPTLQQRGQMGAGADLFISLHSDASDDPTASGVTSFFSVRQPLTEPFATAIGEAAAEGMGNSFRGSVARESETTPGYDYLGVLRAAVAVGAENAFLIEHGFHTNMRDCLTLSDDNALRRIAAAEAAVISRHFQLMTPGQLQPPTESVPPPTPSLCRFSYTVQPGESLYSIGQKFGTSWQEIASANNIVSPYDLMAGQILIIPSSGTVIDYTVQTGDNLYSIGQKLGVPWQAIAIANGIEAPYRLYIGDSLLIPQTCFLYYTIRPGDSLYRIGEKFGISWEDIAVINQLYYPYQISPGMNLMIPLPLV